MSAKLWILNLLLLGGIVLSVRQWMETRQMAAERDMLQLNQTVKPAPAPPQAPVPIAPPLQASSYVDVAQQLLFSKDRNPNIVVEQEKPKVPPAFPRFYGVMDLGDGPMAILGAARDRQRPYKVGETAGEFLVSAIGKEQIEFEWDKRKFPKKFTELQERETASQETPRAVAVNTPAAPQTPAAVTGKPSLGPDMGAGMSGCAPNDPSPAGTVLDGKRKVITATPFGQVCRWEPVR
ncbi:MAG: hypothetical protein HYZ37_16325 [Candidatus Solibacter usitatus]|nr:hypothetical protein [Candidatus Solibacter usitatus]